jgi:hypothetical protein
MLKEVADFTGYYVEPDTGKVYTKWKRSCRGYGKGSVFILTDELRELKPCCNTNYPTLTFYKDKKKYTQKVHVLVLTAAKGPRPDGKVACHNNGDVRDNRSVNLRWDTPKANCRDKIYHGTLIGPRGEKQGHSKLNDKQVRVIKWALSLGVTRELLGLMCKVKPETIGKIARGERWSHITI